MGSTTACSNLKKVMENAKPYAAMIFLQFGYAGSNIISMAQLKEGANNYVLVVYRNAIAAAVIAPFALWFESKVRPRMSFGIFLKIMALSLLEPILDMNLYYIATKATSASFSAALYNIVPAVTFVLAILLRMEKLKMKGKRSQAKIVGTLITAVGALVMILYKGQVIEFFWTKGRSHHHIIPIPDTQDQAHWLMGTILLLISCFCWASFYILQAHTLKSYPAELSLTTLICIMGMVGGGAVALVMEHRVAPWRIGWNNGLLAILYSGIMCSGITYYLQGVVMKGRGPVFVTAFNPLCLVITAIMSSIILVEEITVGRVIGAVIIVIGLYCLIWGKSKDHLNQTTEINEENDEELKLPVAVADVMNNPTTAKI